AIKAKMEKSLKKFQKEQAYCFDDIDRVTELADSLRVSDLSSSLYFERGKFYLDLDFQDENYVELKPDDAWAIATEYGLKVKRSEMARVKTTGKCLIAHDALEQLRNYFTKTKH
ncbi:hypothetical protein EQ500_12805, partial [Lactobacillus sp. XV13L]|nr:hypothetical protein [Lactobacillus sp. XV13L]